MKQFITDRVQPAWNGCQTVPLLHVDAGQAASDRLWRNDALRGLKQEALMKGRVQTAFLAAAASTMLLSAGAALADDMKPQTRQDMVIAMEKEAYSIVKYRAFADHARKSGKIALAELLEQTAKLEEQHFFAEAELYGLVGEDWNNLANAIVSEYNDYTENYAKLAQRAEANGDKEVARKYREIAAEEEVHHKNFQAAVSKSLKSD